MKKFAFALMATVATLFSLGFTSCSDDDDEPSFSENMIYGMWESDYYEYWAKYDGELESDQFKGEFHNGRIYFGKDGTYKSYYKIGSEWVLEERAEWSFSGNKIIISYGEEDGYDKITIKTLTDIKLELESYLKEYDEDEGDVEVYKYITLHKVN